MKLYIVAAAAALTLASCAKREPEDATILQQKSLDAWVEANLVANEVEVSRQSNGVWVQFLEDGDPTAPPLADTAVWVNMRYTATDIAGNVFLTRDSTQALRQRTFSPHTYYVPEFRYCGEREYTSGIIEGVYSAMRDELVRPDGSKTRLREGSHVKLYIPSYLAYSSAVTPGEQGYDGQYALGAGKIVIEDLTIGKVVKNPLSHEEDVVERFATTRWGKERLDTLAPGFYLDTVNYRPRAELLADFPQKEFKKEYALGADSTATIWFIARFLPTEEYPDGFLFDTNITSIYTGFFDRRKNENYTSLTKTLEAMSFKIPTEGQEDQNNQIGAWGKVLPKLRRGQWNRIVFTSSYGYGYWGYSKALLQAIEQQNYINQMYSSYSMYSGYGSSYGGSGYGYDYGGYYNPYGYMSNLSSSTESSVPAIVTEILPYTPLMFEFYIEVPDEE